MATARHDTVAAASGALAVHTWDHDHPRWIAVLVHGYGEHLGRYDHVAARLVRDGAFVTGPDHQGHGLSDGERVLVTDFEAVVDDLRLVVELARRTHPSLPVVMVGHSMGGMIATRYAQLYGSGLYGSGLYGSELYGSELYGSELYGTGLYGSGLAALVLTGPVLGSWQPTELADLDQIPDEPLDVSTLSRDPRVGTDYAADPLVWHGPFKRETLRALATELAVIDAGGNLGSLPVLWVHGADDRLVPIEPTRTGIDRIAGPDLTSKVLPRARHEVLNETNRDEVLDTVSAFALAHV